MYQHKQLGTESGRRLTAKEQDQFLASVRRMPAALARKFLRKRMSESDVARLTEEWAGDAALYLVEYVRKHLREKPLHDQRLEVALNVLRRLRQKLRRVRKAEGVEGAEVEVDRTEALGEALEIRRQERPRQVPFSEVSEEDLVDGRPVPTELFEMEDRAERVRQALAGLSPENADLALYVLSKGKAPERWGRRHGLSRAAVRRRVDRIKKRLRRELCDLV
jgi:DNA-directed RNA polymerase specialized sigma24 family protein